MSKHSGPLDKAAALTPTSTEQSIHSGPLVGPAETEPKEQSIHSGPLEQPTETESAA